MMMVMIITIMMMSMMLELLNDDISFLTYAYHGVTTTPT